MGIENVGVGNGLEAAYQQLEMKQAAPSNQQSQLDKMLAGRTELDNLIHQNTAIETSGGEASSKSQAGGGGAASLMDSLGSSGWEPQTSGSAGHGESQGLSEGGTGSLAGPFGFSRPEEGMRQEASVGGFGMSDLANRLRDLANQLSQPGSGPGLGGRR